MNTSANAGTPKAAQGGRRTAVWVVLVIVVILAAIGIYLATRPSPPGQYDIGVILPLSGNLGYIGEMEADGMRLAEEDINAKGGINGGKLVLHFDDSQGKPDVGVTAANKMMSVDNIQIIMASISSVVLGLKPVVQQNGGILVGLNMHSEFFKDSPHVFRFYEGTEQESAGLAEYLTGLAEADPKPIVGALYADVPNARQQVFDYIQPALRQVGMDFAVAEPYELSTKEFRDKVFRFRAAGATHLVILGYGFQYSTIFQELKEQRLLPGLGVVGGWGFLYPKLAPEDLEGVIVVGPAYVFDQPPEAEDFYRRFRDKFGYEPNFDAVMTYAALELLGEGLRQTEDTKPESVAATLRGLRRVTTLLGTTDVTEEGAVEFSIGTGRFRDGRLRRATP